MIHFSIIGAGGMGSAYAKIINSLSDAKVEYICDVDVERAKRLANEHNAKYTSNIRDAIIDEKVDAIIVTTPPFVRKEIFSLAVEYKKPIYCEKPLSTDYRSAVELYRLIGNKIPVMMGFVLRWWPVYDFIKEKIPKLGKISFAYFTVIGSWITLLDRTPWRKKRSLNSGLMEQAIHEIDIARYLLGEVKQVYAIGNNYILSGIDYEDSAIFSLNFENDAVVGISCSVGSRIGRRDGMIVATNGTIYFDTREQYVKFVDKDDTVEEAKIGFREDPYRKEIIEFIELLKENKKPRATILDGLKAQEIAEAATISMGEKKPIKLPLKI